MRIDFSRTALRSSLVALLVTAAWGSVAAQEASGPFDDLLERLQIKAPPVPTSDFVTASRPKQDTGFIPVGRPHPARATRVMSQAEVAAAEAQLDAARENQQRRAGQVPPAVPLKAPKKTVR